MPEETTTHDHFADFLARLSLLFSKNPELVKMTLSNIFTMRLIGNKTHGDLSEIAIAEFINQYMYDFKSVHVGKDLYRAKSKEEDISIINEVDGATFPLSLKAYGDGPLQLSTDKNFRMYPKLESLGLGISDETSIAEVFASSEFCEFGEIHVLPLIYDERKKQCNIMVFDYVKAQKNTKKITLVAEGSGRKHPTYRFYDHDDKYICEVRYGGPSANALQRGLWTNTKNATDYFSSLTRGWVEYSENRVLVQLFSHALVASSQGHAGALSLIKEDIQQLKLGEGMAR